MADKTYTLEQIKEAFGRTFTSQGNCGLTIWAMKKKMRIVQKASGLILWNTWTRTSTISFLNRRNTWKTA